MNAKMKQSSMRIAGVLAAAITLAGGAVAAAPSVTATAATAQTETVSPFGGQVYDPTPKILYELGSDPCLKGRGNCVIYGKSTQLPSGRLLVAFEKATVPESGSADGQALPVMKSDDDGVSWQPLADVQAPAYASDDPAVDPLTSNWASPYLYVLPEKVGDLEAGTVLLASVVTGEDEYYVEHKAADPDWVPTNDGDRRDIALALYSSTDEGASWKFENIVTKGGWQGGSAGNIGVAISEANEHSQIDPIWEPYLLAHDGELIAYYSDENDYMGVDPASGEPILDPDNDTAADAGNQILAHRTWDGTSSGWSSPVVDVAGLTSTAPDGQPSIGGGRPGMTTVVKTTDGTWMLTFEYWGGGENVRYKIADDPRHFFDGDEDGTPVSTLPLDAGSRRLSTGGSPVLTALPDGRIAYNAGGSGNVWINTSGRSDGEWTEFQTSLGAGYTRTLQPIAGTGRVEIFQSVWGGSEAGSTIRHASVDFGASTGPYYRLVNEATGQVIGTSGSINDANIGNADVPDVRLEDADADATTQLWHVMSKPDGGVTLLNGAGGRAAGIWTGSATAGQRLGQWVDYGSVGLWNVIDLGDGTVRLQSAAAPDLFVSGTAVDAPITLQPEAADGSQTWRFVAESSSTIAVKAGVRCVGGRAVLTVSATNLGDDKSTVDVSTRYGEKTVRSIAAGKTKTVTFSTRAGEIDGGQVAVTSDGGAERAVASYESVSCR